MQGTHIYGSLVFIFHFISASRIILRSSIELVSCHLTQIQDELFFGAPPTLSRDTIAAHALQLEVVRDTMRYFKMFR